ncbi:MAG: DUF4245 domain-containing protein [Candidatus Nanopelagicales bacterium]
MARADRLGTTITGMVLSVVLVFGAVLFVAFFTFKPADETIKTVDFQPTVAAAMKSGPFPPAVPVPVPQGWQATSVRYRVSATDPDLATWHLGFYIPDDEYAAVGQSNGRSDEYLPEVTSKGKSEGQQEVNGQEWTRYRSEETGRLSLVLTQNQLTTVVTGTLTYEALGEFAASLKPL